MLGDFGHGLTSTGSMGTFAIGQPRFADLTRAKSRCVMWW
jgi:hypothetical protein